MGLAACFRLQKQQQRAEFQEKGLRSFSPSHSEPEAPGGLDRVWLVKGRLC